MDDSRYKGWESNFDHPYAEDEDSPQSPPILKPSEYAMGNLDLMITNWNDDFDEDTGEPVVRQTFTAFDVSFQESHDPYTKDELLAALSDAIDAGMCVNLNIVSHFDAKDAQRVRETRGRWEQQALAQLRERYPDQEIGSFYLGHGSREYGMSVTAVIGERVNETVKVDRGN